MALEDAKLGEPPAWASRLMLWSLVPVILGGGSLFLEVIDQNNDLFDRKAELLLAGLLSLGSLGLIVGGAVNLLARPENEKA